MPKIRNITWIKYENLDCSLWRFFPRIICYEILQLHAIHQELMIVNQKCTLGKWCVPNVALLHITCSRNMGWIICVGIYIYIHSKQSVYKTHRYMYVMLHPCEIAKYKMPWLSEVVHPNTIQPRPRTLNRLWRHYFDMVTKYRRNVMGEKTQSYDPCTGTWLLHKAAMPTWMLSDWLQLLATLLAWGEYPVR